MNKNIIFFVSSMNGGAENQLYNLFKLLKNDNKTRYLVAKGANSNPNIISLNKRKTFFI